MLTFQTATDNLLLPVIDTYNRHDIDDYFNDDIEFIDLLDVFLKRQEEDLKIYKSLDTLEDLTSIRLLNDNIKNLSNNDIDFEKILIVKYSLYESHLIKILNDFFIKDFQKVLNERFCNIITEMYVHSELEKPKSYNYLTDRVIIDLTIERELRSEIFDFVNIIFLDSENIEKFERFLVFHYSNVNNVELQPIEFFKMAKKVDTLEFEILLGIVYHYIINDNSFDGLKELIKHRQEDFEDKIIEYMENAITYIDLLPEYYYTDEELRNKKLELEYLKDQPQLFEEKK